MVEEEEGLEDGEVPDKKPEVANKRRVKVERKRCLALKWGGQGNSQCTVLAVSGQQFCGNKSSSWSATCPLIYGQGSMMWTCYFYQWARTKFPQF